MSNGPLLFSVRCTAKKTAGGGLFSCKQIPGPGIRRGTGNVEGLAGDAEEKPAAQPETKKSAAKKTTAAKKPAAAKKTTAAKKPAAAKKTTTKKTTTKKAEE